MASSDKFREYLLARLPDEFPTSTMSLTPSVLLSLAGAIIGADTSVLMHMERNRLNELVFQQNGFLDAAASRLSERPALALITAIKHQCLLKALNLESGRFTDFNDKEYFARVERKCETVREQACGLLNKDSISSCWRLVHLQQHYPMISETIDLANTAISKGIRSLEPQLVAPEKLGDPVSGAIPFGVSIASGLTVFAFDYYVLGIVPFAPPIVAAVVGFCIAAVAVIPKAIKEHKANSHFEQAMGQFAQFEKLRKEFYALITSYDSDLGLNSKKMAADLAMCVKQLTQLMKQRQLLEDHLIGPA